MQDDDRTVLSPFGFPLVVKNSAPFSRNELTEYLEINKIGTRNVFAGNLLRHPAYIKVRSNFKIMGDMSESDIIMNSAFWLGVWPGIDKKRMSYMKKNIKSFIETFNRTKE
jgi:CDP-6-deoxy-D-xylo-4-hexulose-3-dehydrase